MALILTRSPYFVSKGNFDNGALLSVTISNRISASSVTTLKTYNLNFFSQQYIDISPLIRDYLDNLDVLVVSTTVSGAINEVTQSDVLLSHIAVDGYAKYEEGFNPDLSTELSKDSYYAGSNKTIHRHDDKPLSIPLLLPLIDGASATPDTNVTIAYYNGSSLISTVNTNFSAFTGGNDVWKTSNRVNYISESEFDSFEERVLADGGTFEYSKAVDKFNDAYSFFPATKVVISVDEDVSKRVELNIVPVSECKYEPKKLKFINKYGVKEDLWFFKKSTNSLSTKTETYRANTLNSFALGDLSKHSMKSFNTNGKESMTINSGFVPESFSENFKQLMLSERVWLDTGAVDLPITIKSSDLELKTSVNEKLINYTINIEFAFDTINNIN